MRSKSIIEQKSLVFALRIIKAFRFLKNKKENILCLNNYLDFIHKLHISLKEANETDYWLTLLHESDYINDIAFQSIQTDCTELIKLLTSIIKSSKYNSDASTVINY